MREGLSISGSSGLGWLQPHRYTAQYGVASYFVRR